MVPVEPSQTVLQHHTVVVKNGVIEALLPTDKAVKKYPHAPQTLLDDHVLIPGLINTHTHAAMSLLRGLADDLNLHTWLNDHIWPTEAKWVDAHFVRDGSELAIAEMLRGGTTLFADMYFYPEDTAITAQNAQMRACIGLMVMDFPTVWGAGPDDYFEKGLQVHDAARPLSLVNTMFTPHAPYTVSDAPLQQTMTYADELQIPVQMHVHETAQEIDDAMAASGIRPLQRLHDLGLLNPRLLAVHMTQLNDDEITLLAREGVHVVHCPKSNAKLGSGQCRVADLLAAGVNVALGTDGAASNNNLDMLSEMRAAALMAKQHSGNAQDLPAWQVLEMATINGAKALNLQSTLGSLTPGKYADLCAIDLRHVATQPVYDPISQLIYSASSEQVSDVWVHGNRVVKNKELLTIDTNKLLQRVQRWGEKIKPTTP